MLLNGKNENRCTRALASVGSTLLIAGLTACDQGASPNADNNDAGTSDGYYAGYDLGIKLAELRQQYPGIELDEAFKGMLDALSDTSQQVIRTELCTRLQPAEARPAEADYEPVESVQPSQTEARPHNIFKADFSKDDFAARNAKREGVVSLPSGVQYEVLKAGSGEPPGKGDAVVISYQASFADGTVNRSRDDDDVRRRRRKPQRAEYLPAADSCHRRHERYSRRCSAPSSAFHANFHRSCGGSSLPAVGSFRGRNAAALRPFGRPDHAPRQRGVCWPGH